MIESALLRHLSRSPSQLPCRCHISIHIPEMNCTLNSWTLSGRRCEHDKRHVMYCDAIRNHSRHGFHLLKQHSRNTSRLLAPLQSFSASRMMSLWFRGPKSSCKKITSEYSKFSTDCLFNFSVASSIYSTTVMF